MVDHPAPPPVAPVPLVGREREQANLRVALDAVLAGQGALVLFGGEAGIGKTALAEWALAAARQRGAMVLVGRCYDLSETPPYGPWAEALARVPGGADRLAAPDLAIGAGTASQAALFAQVREYLATLAARRPLVLLLDDLHWADPASLDLLRFLGRAVADLSLLLLATYRSDELTRRHPLSTLLPLLVREARATRLDLRPLDEAGLAALVAPYALPPGDEARLVAYLAARAEGNPFFAGELLRALEGEGTLHRTGAGWALRDLAAAGMPPLLRQVLDARLDRLGEDARDLLAVAAVIGQEVPFALWQVVGGADEGALLGAVQPATAAHLLAELPDGSGARFAHALVREALYEGTPALQRRALHRRAGAALAATAAPDPDVVAHHFQRAGDDRALAWLVRAGDRAFRAYALASADARYEAALALLDRSDATPAERGWLLLRLVARLRTADPARAFTHLEEARPAIAAAGDPLLAACALLLAGLIRCWLLQARRGLDEMAAGFAQLAALRAAQPGATLAVPRCVRDALGDSGGSLALEQAGAGRYDDALALSAQILAAAPPGDQPADLRPSFVHWARATALAGRGLAAEASASFERAMALDRAAGHFPSVAFQLASRLHLAHWPYAADRPAERARLLAALLEARAHSLGRLPPLAAYLGRTLLHEGRWEALRAAPPIPGLGDRILIGPRARLAAWEGEPEAAWRAIRRFLPEGARTPPGDAQLPPALELQQVAIAVLLEAGDLPAARDWLACHDRWLAWADAALGQAEGQLAWAAYHRAAGDLATARQHAERALARASDPRQPLALLAAHRLLGELATEAGQHGDAAAHLDRALALATACAAPYERALTLLALAELRAATGDRNSAAATLTESHAILAPLEAKPALAHADALAARLAAGPAALPFGLTAREAEVLRLVARGLSNAAVAGRLFLSPRTINTHLTSIYTKLGVDNRAAATRLAVERGLA